MAAVALDSNIPASTARVIPELWTTDRLVTDRPTEHQVSPRSFCERGTLFPPAPSLPPESSTLLPHIHPQRPMART